MMRIACPWNAAGFFFRGTGLRNLSASALKKVPGDDVVVPLHIHPRLEIKNINKNPFLPKHTSPPMSFKRSLLIFCLCPLMVACFALTGFASTFLALSDLGVDNRDGHLSVGFNIAVHDEASFLDVLQSGGTFLLSCQAEMFRARPALWNEKMASVEHSWEIMSNPMARECQIRDKQGLHVFSFSSLREDLMRYWAGSSVQIIPWEKIERNNLYKVRIVFSMKRTNMPQWVTKPLFFVNWDIIPETEYELTFDY